MKSNCILWLIIVEIICFVIGFSLLISGCSELYGTCIYYDIIHANITDYNIDKNRCQKCTQYIKHKCIKYDSYKCWDTEVYLGNGDNNDFLCKIIVATNQNKKPKINSLEDYKLGETKKVMIQKYTHHCLNKDEQNEVESNTISGIILLSVVVFIGLLLILSKYGYKSAKIMNENINENKKDNKIIMDIV